MKSLFALLFFLPHLHAQPSAVLGKIGEIEIKTEEVREAIAGLEAGQEAALTKDPAAVSNYIRALLVQRLVLKQAVAKKIDQDPAVIAKLVRARETALTEAYLDSFSTPPAAYPSAAELAAAYEAAKSSLVVPKSYRLAQIFVAAVPNAAATPGSKTAPVNKAEARIQEISKRLKVKGADFAEIARTTSEETVSAAKGGEIGWLSENQIQPEIRDRLPKLTVNTISEPIQLKDGWHIIKVLDTKESSTATLDQVRVQLAAKLRAEKTKQLRQEYIAGLVKDNPVAINEIELSKILPKSGN